MKQTAVIFCLFLTLSATFSKWMLIASYNINQNFIATQLCINKAKPKSCCKGKCYLGKQMTKEEKGESSATPIGKEKFDVYVASTLPELITTSAVFTPIKHLTPPTNWHYQQCLQGCFRPPQA